MCGIAGMVTTRPHALREVVERMTGTLTHRGPDADGFYIDPPVGLGHRRLRIIDLATGDQPMISRSGRHVISYNGELYNYLELRRALIAQGCDFRTQSDTEVLLELLAGAGWRSIERCLGMFAIALWDRAERSLVLIRDRLGVKPLWYIHLPDGSLAFASEIKALLTVPGVQRRLNRPALVDYLLYRQPGRTASLFEGIRQLAPGTALMWHNGQITEQRFWDLDPLRLPVHELGSTEAVHLVRDEVTAAVRRRMMADVPLGAYLSGGLDSSIVVAVMAQHSSEPVKTFSIGFPEEGFNEFQWARLVAERYSTDHHEIDIDLTDYQNLWRAMICFRDAPLSVPNEVALYRMSLELKRYITVVLSGEGADELFAGYGRIFRSADDFARMQILQRQSELFSKEGRELFAKPLRERYGRLDFESDLAFFRYRYQWFTEREAALLLRADAESSPMTREFDEAVSRVQPLDVSSRFLYLFQLWHLHGLLMRLDATTMASAVEARVPFVDHTLIEAVFPLAFDLKCRFQSEAHALAAQLQVADTVSEVLDTTKWVLREAFRSDLPEGIVKRRKVGFPVPLSSWLHQGLADFAREVIFQRSVREQGVFSEQDVEHLIATAVTQEEALKVWMLCNVSLFLAEYFA